jgi:hypothetical protein
MIGGVNSGQWWGMDGSFSRNVNSRLTVGTLLLAIAVGCHGSSTANLGGFSSSIPGGTQFDQLSSAQVQTFCSEVDSFETTSGQAMDDLEITCLFGGLIAAELSAAPQTNASVQAACTTAYNQCIAGATSTFSCPSMTALSSCTATISEYAACLNDATKIEVQAIQSLPTCADLTVADLTTSSGTLSATPPPPSCQTLNAKCPALAMGAAGSADGGAGPDGSSTTDGAGTDVDAGWPVCPVITGWAIMGGSSCYFYCSTNAGSGDPHDFPSCVTSNQASPGLGLPDGVSYCIQTNVAQATCP